MKVQLNISKPESWLTKSKKVIIAGPCSAESEDQVLATAHALSKSGNYDIFRAGIWKPRTRPNSFEGIGSVGLKWLQRVKEETGMKIIIEVASKYHVEEALKHEVDMLWVGARTTVNPFSVQEIADALQGHDIPVFIKNPVSPDLPLWIGALERMNKAGITKLAAIHRGFIPLSASQFRNDPIWELPIELKRIVPDLPIICDPSHICGARELIGNVAQKALDLQMDGLMIESHINPDAALSDPKQQLTPDALKRLIKGLIFRDKYSKDSDFNERLEKLRNQIDTVDEELLSLISSRMKIAEEIAWEKKKSKVTILQVNRYKEILKDRKVQGENLNLNAEFVQSLYKLIHRHSIQKQSEIMNSAVKTI